MTSSQFTVRSINADEWTLVRDLRLRALRDAPTAFATTEADARTQTEEEWRRLTESMTGSALNAMFVATSDGEYIGSVYALIDRTDERTGRIGGLWVDSQRRRRGAGHRLIRAVRLWAENLSRHRLRLWVPADEAPAQALYAREGFVPTGRTDSFPRDLGRSIVEMELVLDPRSSARADGE